MENDFDIKKMFKFIENRYEELEDFEIDNDVELFDYGVYDSLMIKEINSQYFLMFYSHYDEGQDLTAGLEIKYFKASNWKEMYYKEKIKPGIKANEIQRQEYEDRQYQTYLKLKEKYEKEVEVK